MKVIKTETRRVVPGDKIVLDLCTNKEGATTVGEVYVTRGGKGPISISGCIDGKVDDNNGIQISAINMETFAVTDDCVGCKYFLIPTTGLSQLSLYFSIDEVEDDDITIKEVF